MLCSGKICDLSPEGVFKLQDSFKGKLKSTEGFLVLYDYLLEIYNKDISLLNKYEMTLD